MRKYIHVTADFNRLIILPFMADKHMCRTDTPMVDRERQKC